MSAFNREKQPGIAEEVGEADEAGETVYLGVRVEPQGGIIESYSDYRTKATALESVRFNVVNNFDEDYQELLAACTNVVTIERPDEVGGTTKRKIGAVGLAVAGQVTQDRTDISVAGSLRSWVNRKLPRKLERALDCPVVLGNDAEAAALAETWYGSAPAYKFAFFMWDAGVSGCEVLRDGRKPLTISSELGHQIVDPDATETRCGCGNPGCLESLVGGWSLERFEKPLDQLPSSQRDEVLKRLTIGVYNTLRIVPVSTVVFGGRLAVAYSQFLPEIEKRLRHRLSMSGLPSEVIVRLADKEMTAGTLGALALLRQELEGESEMEAEEVHS